MVRGFLLLPYPPDGGPQGPAAGTVDHVGAEEVGRVLLRSPHRTAELFDWLRMVGVHALTAPYPGWDPSTRPHWEAVPPGLLFGWGAHAGLLRGHR